MRKLSFLIALLQLMSSAMFAQVSISSDNSAPDISTMLDVKSTTRGMLVPRMTSSERDLITNPATGLVIYSTDNNMFYFNKGTPAVKNWTMINTQWNNNDQDIFYDGGKVLVGTFYPPTHSLNINGSQNSNYALRLIGSEGSYGHGAALDFGDVGYAFLKEYEDDKLQINAAQGVRMTGGNVGIGTLTPSLSAKLDINSTNSGLLIPRMTNAQITTFGSTLSAADKGMIVFNIDDIKIEFWDGTAWKTMVTKTSSSGSSSDGTSFCSEGVTDYDGHNYSTVKIGDQCWMAENLKSTHYADGSAITEHWTYDFDEALAHTYGRLYTWAAVMNGSESSESNPSGVQGICPDGWHMPSDAEWKELEMTLGMTTAEADALHYRGSHSEGRKLRETDDAFLWLIGCSPSNYSGTNNSGFTALPGGSRDLYGLFNDLTYRANFWSSSEYSSSDAWYRGLMCDWDSVHRYFFSKADGFSVRCLKD